MTLSSPAISPDGTRAVVVVGRVDWNENRTDRDLELIDLATKAHRPLTYKRKGLAAPAFSPDGKQLAFLAQSGTGDAAPSQVFVMPMDGGDARPVTNAPEGVEQFAWRPDGNAMAYAAEDRKPKKTGADRFRDGFDVTTEPITSRSRPRPLHLWLQTIGGAAKQLTRGTSSIAAGEAQSTLSWSPDGATIAYVRTPSAILDDAVAARVVLVDTATGAERTLTSHTGYEADPQFSPDGKHIAYQHSEDDNQITLTETWVTTPAGGDGTPLTRPLDRAVQDAAWSPSSAGVAVRTTDGTATALTLVPLNAAPQRIELGGLIVSSPLAGAIAKNAFVAIGSMTTRPPELYLIKAGEPPQRLTDFNAKVAALDLGHAERITFPTSLGIAGDGVLTYPPGFTPGRTYPLVLLIHGGPTSASTLGFDRLTQLMAARGWLVLSPNYRGSFNLGLQYQRGVRYDPSAGPGRDIIAAIGAVRAKHIVDDSRLAVSGWSYGGIMTSWMISKYHVWRAAVSGASVNDWAADYGISDDAQADKALFHGSPYVAGNAAEWRAASAMNYVKDVTTPLLILHDVGDNRDAYANATMYYHALKDNGKDVRLYAWPVDAHFPRDPVRTADVYDHWIGFLAEHLK